MEASNQHPSTFTRTELERALTEQSFGVISSKILHASEREATAMLVLLEGNAMTISLSSRGFLITSDTASPYTHVGDAYETLEDLLSTVSKQYNVVKHQVLTQKLSALSATTTV
ncbi:hypothetical protein C8Q75DRAFT_147242 [Abortiporus biennis]|nr:hypothetical protein C8Q75DRAFT_147242 [Abortiporus biennis]